MYGYVLYRPAETKDLLLLLLLTYKRSFRSFQRVRELREEFLSFELAHRRIDLTTMDTLPDQLLTEILCFVPPIDLLRSTLRVSKRFASLVHREQLWRFMGGDMLPKDLNTHQIQRCCIYASSDAEEMPQCLKLKKCLKDDSLLVPKDQAIGLRRTDSTLRVCLASTTEHSNEYIENVLPQNDSVWGARFMETVHDLFGRWWSSGPADNEESDELLLFTLRWPDTVVSEVSIKPLKDPYFSNTKYTWKKIIVKAYRLPVEEETTIDQEFINCPMCTVKVKGESRLASFSNRVPDDRESIETCLSGQVLVYDSGVIDTPAVDCDSWQHYTLPKNVVANVITFELIGKNSRQFPDSGFYVCVERVMIRGIPLYQSPNQDWRSSPDRVVVLGNSEELEATK